MQNTFKHFSRKSENVILVYLKRRRRWKQLQCTGTSQLDKKQSPSRSTFFFSDKVTILKEMI